ncbi:MAG: hypothetical protein R8K20_10305 [Gallionellaceae bacterium]
MIVRQLKTASDELSEALAWYRDRSQRVAEELWLRVCDALDSVVSPCFAVDHFKGKTFYLVRLPL